MITMEEYADLLPAHNQIINYYMRLAKSERENEGSFNRKVKKALRKDLIKRINEAIDVINCNFKLEKKNANSNVKLSKVKYKPIKNVDKAMKKLEVLQNKVDAFLLYSTKGRTIEDNNTSSNAPTSTEGQPVNTDINMQEQNEVPTKVPDVIEGQMDIEELEGIQEQPKDTENHKRSEEGVK